MKEEIKNRISESIQVKQFLLQDESNIQTIQKMAEEIVNAYKRGNKVLFCGNGGSAADAQHLSAELAGRFYLERKGLNAEALHVNTSYLTAISNDYNFEIAYARLIEATAVKGDVLFALSTSGSSRNILHAIDAAKETGMIVIGLTGESGGFMNKKCDHIVKVKSSDTPRIQETHILIGHIICELVEKELFGSASSNSNFVDQD